MKAARMMADANEGKVKLASDYTEIVHQLRLLETQKERLRKDLLPQMTVGEQIGAVKKTTMETLDVNKDAEDMLKARGLWEQVTDVKVSVSRLRDVMKGNPEIDKAVLRKTTEKLEVE